MATTNQFYPFATAGGAYVLSNAAYQALAARSSGYPAGILPKENLNSAMRQAAFGVAALSQFIADNQPTAVNDDGVIVNYTNVLRKGLRNFNGSDNYLTDTGAANAYVVAYTPAQAAYSNGLEVNFKPANANTGASTLDAGLGTSPLVRSDGGALQPGDLLAGTNVNARYDQPTTAWRVMGVVFSQLGALTGARYITSAVTLGSGVYGANTLAGAFTATLPLSPATGTQITITDLTNNFGVNNLTIAPNGQTIMGQSGNLVVNVSDIQFTLFFNGTTWKLV